MDWSWWKVLIFIWLSFSVIKAVIVFGTMIKFGLERKIPIFSVITAGFVTSVVAAFQGPLILLVQKSEFFKFPDERLYKMLIDYYNSRR